MARCGYQQHFGFRKRLSGHARGEARAEVQVDEEHSRPRRRRDRQQPAAKRQDTLDGEPRGRAGRRLSRLGRARGGELRRADDPQDARRWGRLGRHRRLLSDQRAVARARRRAAPRGVGATSLARLDELALDETRPLLALAATPPPDIRGKARAGLEDLAATVARLASQRGELSPPAFIDLVLQASGYRKTLEQDRSPEAEGRLENLEELVAAAEDFTHAEGETTVEAFLDSVALMSDIDELKEAEARVTLMTLHSAKGLEFPVVFLSGLEEGVFPHARSMSDPEEIEEER